MNGIARGPALGAAVALALFLLDAAMVASGATVALDQAMLARAHGLALDHALIRAAIALTRLGAAPIRGPIALVGALILFGAGQRRQAITLAGAWVIGLALLEGLKDLFARARPDLPFRLVTATQTSFPSGHALGSMILYPLLGLLIGGLAGRSSARIGGALGLLLALLIGSTRVLLGVHWLCDVIGGWLLGLAVVGAVLALNGVPAAEAATRD